MSKDQSGRGSSSQRDYFSYRPCRHDTDSPVTPEETVQNQHKRATSNQHLAPGQISPRHRPLLTPPMLNEMAPLIDIGHPPPAYGDVAAIAERPLGRESEKYLSRPNAATKSKPPVRVGQTEAAVFDEHRESGLQDPPQQYRHCSSMWLIRGVLLLGALLIIGLVVVPTRYPRYQNPDILGIQNPAGGGDREIHIVSPFRAVRGNYSLLDLLSIKTTTGLIDVDVKPEEVDPDNPRAAFFIADSKAGSIHATFPFEGDIPERKYITTARSVTGSITGNFIHGSITTIYSQTGSVVVDIMPYKADPGNTDLTVSSRTGRVEVNLASAFKDPTAAITRLSGKFEASTGSVKITYPEEWEGKIYLASGTGSIMLRGKDVKIINKGRNGAGQFIDATKGNGTGELRVWTSTGSVDVTIGEAY